MDYLYVSLVVMGLLIFLCHYPLYVLPVLCVLLFLYAKRARIEAEWDRLLSQNKAAFVSAPPRPLIESSTEARITAAAEEARLLDELRHAVDEAEVNGDGLVLDYDDDGEYEDDGEGTEDRLLRRRIPPPVPPKPERSFSREEFDEKNRSRLPPYLLVKSKGEEEGTQRRGRLSITNQVNAIAGHFADRDNAPLPNAQPQPQFQY